MKKLFNLLLALLLAFGFTSSLIISSFGASEISFSSEKNSGQRDVVCTSLDGTSADEYYAAAHSYEKLSALDKDALLDALRALMTDTHTTHTTYDQCKTYSNKTDCQNGDGGIVMLYTSFVAQYSDFIGSGSIGWNREHVWPKSLGGFKDSGAGADLHHIRPCDSLTNSRRGNLKYGNAEGGTDAAGSSLVGGISGGKYTGGFYEPLDNVKGDVARICLYVYARYGAEYSKCSSITNVFESVDVLLDWCASDPVDTWEMGRNEVVGKIQGNRNVFIDYPEYAWLLFGKDIPENMLTPSGFAMSKDDAVTSSQDTSIDTTRADAPDTSADTSDNGGCASYVSFALIPSLLICAISLKKKNN